MKHILVALSLIALCTPQITCAMERTPVQKIEISMDEVWNTEDPQAEELQPINTPTQQKIESTPITTTTDAPLVTEDRFIDVIAAEKLINLIDAEILATYYRTLFGHVSATELTKEHCYDIILIINRHTKTPSNYLINQLRKKNSYCYQAMKHFMDLAHKNVDNVTIDTLEIIQDPALEQPTKELNKLPLAIKTYLMVEAYNNINNHSCDIILSGHTDIITFFEICATIHHAATSSKDKTLRLWDLLTGKLIHQFPGNNNKFNCIMFNGDGSLLATAKNSKSSSTSTIKIWDTQSNKLINCIKNPSPTDLLSFGDNRMISACCKSKQYLTTNIFCINTSLYLTSVELPHVPLGLIGDGYQDSIGWNHLYKAQNPYNKPNKLGSTLTIKKLNCRPLYLCEKIIENTPKMPRQQMENLPLFCALTQYEKDIIWKKEID